MEADAGTRRLNLTDSAPAIHSEAGETMILNRLAPLAIPLSVHARTDQHPPLGHPLSTSGRLVEVHPLARPARAAPVDVSDSTTSEHSGMLFGLGRTRRVSQYHVHTAAAGRDALSDGSA